jgi:hypothetical protein
MEYIIGLKENPKARISRILGRVEANSPGGASAEARLAFGADPLDKHPSRILPAMMVQTLYLVGQGKFISIKKDRNERENEGAISKDARWIYVNANKGRMGRDRVRAPKAMRPRMHALKHALVGIRVERNRNKGHVMGDGSGVNYTIFARFRTVAQAKQYIESLGFNLVVVDNAGFAGR